MENNSKKPVFWQKNSKFEKFAHGFIILVAGLFIGYYWCMLAFGLLPF